MRLWWTQMALNFLWSPTFFGAHMARAALAIIIMMVIAVLAFIALSWRNDRTSAVLFIPYAAWIGFATALNLSIVLLR